jgi:DNA-binding protein YbaB
MWGGGDPGVNGLLDPDSAHEQIARWRDRVDRMASDTKAMSDRLQQVQVTATDINSMVEVTVDVSGRLVNLRLTERARRASPDTIATTIMQTIASATGQLGERARQIITETMGEDSPAGREMAERMAQHLSRRGQAPGDDHERRR